MYVYLGGWDPRTCKYLGPPPFTSHKDAIWKRVHNPILGDLVIGATYEDAKVEQAFLIYTPPKFDSEWVETPEKKWWFLETIFPFLLGPSIFSGASCQISGGYVQQPLFVGVMDFFERHFFEASVTLEGERSHENLPGDSPGHL